MGLDADRLLSHLKKTGLLAQSLSHFEERPEQQEMLQSILKSCDQNTLALIEAGTGVGKSMAYLIAALALCQEQGHDVVISTHTITLQEQLLEKDLPFLLETLGLNIKVTLVKGMGNYLCFRKLFDLMEQKPLLPETQQQELLELEKWAQETEGGSSSELASSLQHLHWEKVNCESSACSFVKCPYYKECFFFRARKKVKESRLLVVNHSLLMVDLEAKMSHEGKGSILPDYEHLIIDEAHTFEDIATQSLARSCSQSLILRKLQEVYSDRLTSGKIKRLKYKLLQNNEEIPSFLVQPLEIDIPAQKREVEALTQEAFHLLLDFLEDQDKNTLGSHKSFRLELTSALLEHPRWEEIQKAFERLVNALKQLATDLLLFAKKIEELPKQKVKPLESLLIDLKALALFFETSSSLIHDFFKATLSDDQLFVLEWHAKNTFSNVHLSIILLNISKILAKHLFSPLISGVLCSATLNHRGSFEFVKNQLGLSSPYFQSKPPVERILPSPFDYPNQALLAAISDMPYPTSSDYLFALCEQIKQALKASQGGAFILFTSYKMLEESYEKLLPFMREQNLLPLKQGEENRSVLLDLFKETSQGVLFGTDTFWEGIDVPGFHLRLVILTKLPFPVPTEPLFQARCKQLEKEGKSSFYEYSIPKALVKFKQGFGRLIRNQSDFGCILCLDSRLLNKSYGKIFIQSLPTCKTSFGKSQQVQRDIQSFFNQKLSAHLPS